jgi:lysophospholipid acyltransferase (LPLAT)-like uncharacterized protein
MSALPGSGCGRIRVRVKIQLQVLALTIDFFKLIWESLKNFAKAKEVAALANSEGCIVNFRAYQQR